MTAPERLPSDPRSGLRPVGRSRSWPAHHCHPAERGDSTDAPQHLQRHVFVEHGDERQQVGEDSDTFQTGSSCQLREPRAPGQVRHQPCRPQPRRREPRMTVADHQRRRQSACPIPSHRMATNQELIASGANKTENLVLPLSQHRNHPLRRRPNTNQHGLASDSDGVRSNPRHPATVQPRTESERQQRPSRPQLPGRRLSQGIRPQTIDLIGAIRHGDLAACDSGRPRFPRCPLRQQRPHPPQSHPIRGARPIVTSPTATNRSTTSGSRTTSGSSGSFSPTAHTARRASTRTTRNPPALQSMLRRSALSTTKGRAATHVPRSMPRGRYDASRPSS